MTIISIIVVIVLLAIIGVVIFRAKKGTFSSKVKSAYRRSDMNEIRQQVAQVVDRDLSFVSDVVSYFKSLSLNPKTDIPFIMDGSKLPTFIDGMPQDSRPCVLLGVYREETDEITDCQLIIAQSFDTKTKEVLEKSEDGIVALS